MINKSTTRMTTLMEPEKMSTKKKRKMTWMKRRNMKRMANQPRRKETEILLSNYGQTIAL